MRPATAIRRLLALTTVSAVAVLGLAPALTPAPALAADADTVAVPDAALARGINAALGAGRAPGQAITAAEARSLTSLTVSGASGAGGVADLTGLEAFTGLRTLALTAAPGLSDADPLAALPLDSLAITGGSLQGALGRIGRIDSLTSLTLAGAGIFDAAPLAGLSRLQTLRLPQNRIADAAPFAQLPTVTAFDLSGNRIESLAPLASRPNLVSLRLSDNRIRSASPLVGYAGGRLGTSAGALAIDGNRIADLSPFRIYAVRPAYGDQQIHAGAYRSGGVTVALARGEGDLPIAPADPAEGAYDRASGLLTLTDPTLARIALAPSWTVRLGDAPADPGISGSAVAGQSLAADPGDTAASGCTTAYQWQREGLDVPGATGRSYALTPADIGSRITVRAACGDRAGVSAPTASVRAAGGAAPVILPSQPKQAGVLAAQDNPGITLRVGQTLADGSRVDPTRLTVTAVSSSRPGVLPVSGVRVTGTGSVRTVAFTPNSRGGPADIRFEVRGPDGATATATVSYSASIATTPTSRVLMGQGDSSTAIDAGDGYLFVADDERSQLGLYRSEASGPPVWESESLSTREIDFESSATQGDTAYFFGSHGNKKKGDVETSRHAVYAMTVTGTGARARLDKSGEFFGMRRDLIAWDRANGSRFGFEKSELGDKAPDLADGFNIEGAEFSPDGSELYLAFRSPAIQVDGVYRALIVPVTNFTRLFTGEAETATFGEPILLDLAGQSIREIRKNARGQYLIIGGTPGLWTEHSAQSLFAWSGHAADRAVQLTTPVTPDLEPLHTDNAGAWEGIGILPDNLTEGATVRLIMDQGYDVLYDTGSENKKSDLLIRKARTEQFTLSGNVGPHARISGPVAFGEQTAATVSRARTVTLTSTGSERLSVRDAWIESDTGQRSEFLISANTCARVQPGPDASCEIDLRYAPAEPGASAARLVIESNLPGADRVVELSGTATAPPTGEPEEPEPEPEPKPETPERVTRHVSTGYTVRASAVAGKRLSVRVSARGVPAATLNRTVTVRVSGVTGSYRAKLTRGAATVALGKKAKRVKKGKRVRVTVVVPRTSYSVTTRTPTRITTTATAVSQATKTTRIRLK